MRAGPPLDDTLRLLTPLASNLEIFNLSGNKLGGTITDDIAAFSKLTELRLGLALVSKLAKTSKSHKAEHDFETIEDACRVCREKPEVSSALLEQAYAHWHSDPTSNGPGVYEKLLIWAEQERAADVGDGLGWCRGTLLPHAPCNGLAGPRLACWRLPCLLLESAQAVVRARPAAASVAIVKP